jgi:hypothetical protein
LSHSASESLHARLHWDAIRAVCRNPRLDRKTRREKLRFFISGLSRSRRVPVTM